MLRLLVSSPVITRRLEVRSEDVTQRRLALDALLFLRDLLQFELNCASLCTNEIVDNGGHCFTFDPFILAAMCHQNANVVAQLSTNAGIAFENVQILILVSELLLLDLVVLGQREEAKSRAALFLAGQVVAVHKRLHDLLKAIHQAILAHGLDHHVRRELLRVMVHENDSILLADGLQPVEEIKESCDLSLGFNDLWNSEVEDKAMDLFRLCAHVSQFFHSYLVSLHGFQHTETSHVNYTNLMTLTSAWIQVHQWHDVLGELCSWRVCRKVHNL